ncbi:MAG: hypothetical protein HKN87_02120 [Saprospiraceae bacterium]|nr:hypothetical protein [Saprospiraceae bacterium]
MADTIDHNSSESLREDEVTLKQLIVMLREYIVEVLSHWKLAVLICLPFVAYKLYDAWTTKVVYPATLTFMVDEHQGGGSAGIANVLGQFGISGVQHGKYNLDKILEISRSRRVLRLALFTKAKMRGKEDFLANHLLGQFDFHEKWKDDTTGLRDYLFDHGRVEEFSRLDNRVLKSLQGLLNGSSKKPGVYNTSYDEDTGIMSLKMSAPSEDLSITIVDTIFSKLTNYYVGNAIEKAEATYKVMRNKTDSLAQALAAAEYRLADFIDKNKNIYSARQGTLQQSRLTAEVNRLQIMHGESLKNLEYADFALKNKTPFIALIDDPIPPLNPEIKSKLMALIIGLIMGIMVAVTFIIGRKIYRDAMAA